MGGKTAGRPFAARGAFDQDLRVSLLQQALEGGQMILAAQVQALVNLAERHFGRVDVIINNAGLMAIAPMQQARTDEWDRMIDINIKGVLYGVAGVGGIAAGFSVTWLRQRLGL